MGMHQIDPLARLLFEFTHFHVLHSSSNIFLSYIFPSLANDTHTFGLTHVVPLAFDQLISMQLFV
jgi:hypothetical protein